MTPHELGATLNRVAAARLRLSLMLWGPPGVGKSSLVAQVAQAAGLDCLDLRLSQLAPTDLRGLPVAEDGIARWYPPEFLPREGAGILFLDEINMAPPAMQGVAQQLILDRRVGSYRVPDDWLIWAAGNRQEDQAAVYAMPAPLANRFVHLEVEPDFDSFKHYGLDRGLHEQILAFLSYRPALLHRLEPGQPAWPSPRSWEMADALHRAELDIAPAVGVGPASEFAAFVALYRQIPDLDALLEGRIAPPFPSEPSARYAVILGLTLRAVTDDQAQHAFRWLLEAKAGAEWVQLFASDLFRRRRARGTLGTLTGRLARDPSLRRFLADYKALLGVA